MPYNPANFIVEPFFHIVENPQDILDSLKPLGGKYITFDTETHPTVFNSHQIPNGMVRRWVGSGKKAVPQDLPFCISICDGTNCYTIFDSIQNKFAKFKALQSLFADESIEKIAHNVHFDQHVLANIGIKIRGKLHDTVIVAKLADENRHSFKLRDLAAETEQGIIKYELMVDNYKAAHKVVDYRQIPVPLLGAYANADVWNCMQVFLKEHKVLKTEELEELYATEMKLLEPIYWMERHGIRVDLDYEIPLKEELQSKADQAESAIYEEAGCLFNINSGKQLYNVLLKLDVDSRLIKMSDKGNPVLDKDALNTLAEKHGISIVLKILEFRKYEKLLGTYADGIYAQRDSVGKVHCSINQCEAVTGRMSITKPALQTIPKKDKLVKKMFIPTDGYTFYFMDYKAVEYRLLAHYAQATGLIDAIKKGHDVHQATAAIIYTMPYEEVQPEQRQIAKTINFSLVYGQGDAASAASLEMTISDARRFKDMYFNSMPEIAPFIQQVQRVNKARGYVRNYYGRRRRLTYDESYKAPNALIQGCAADLMKAKIVELYEFLTKNNYKTRMLFPVHDSVTFEVHNSELHIVPHLKWVMSDFKNFRVPIEVDVEIGGPSWGEASLIEIEAEEPT
jgi:DNA polymerase-1